MSRQRWFSVPTAIALSAVAGLILFIAILAFGTLSGEPSAEESDQCLGGGHTDYAVALLVVASAGLLASIATLGQSIRGRRVWLPGLLAVGLLTASLLLLAGMPIALDIDVGQC